MIGAVDIGDRELVLVDVKAADGAVVKQKPRPQPQRRLPPGKLEHGAHQTHEKTAMADECDAMFRLPILILVASQQFSEYLIRTRLALLVSLIGAVPPACLVQIVRQCQGTKVFHEIRTRPARQDLEVGFVHTAALRRASLVFTAVDAALLMNLFPGDQGDIQSSCNRGGSKRGALH